ncbi:MAG: ArsJ-associated glyceraldehyde-3-phosphate dehydrogenase [Cyanobacterium sp. T60_A2020_053]|nr:ArsJ-associated glyceraldehyde-3-phosphate dehydrogenase [Cyanobacterium sp. T60_A2020_053]
MAIRVGINGFGRIGRLAMRAGWGNPAIEFVHINEIKGGAVTGAHLLTYDSVHGKWDRKIDVEGEKMTIEGQEITYSEFSTPQEVPWADYGVDIVIESSGKFRTPETLNPYFDCGVKKVVVAAPVKENAFNVVVGVNDHLYDPDKDHILTAASCTTNCLAPIVKVIQEGLGIKHGAITTIHDVTNTQIVVDAPHKDLRRARSCLESLVPTTTGSATAIAMIYPELKGKINGLAVRVPLLNASLTDCVFEVNRPTTVEEVNKMLKEASNKEPLKDILGYEELPLVSVDYKDDPRSSIVDALSTMVIDETQVKILAWYDNEWGYSNRLVELVAKIASSL